MYHKVLRGLLFLGSLFIFSPFANAETITQDTVWSGEKNVNESVSVSAGAKLNITKGTRIIFSDDAILDILGTLEVDGTVMSPVSIRGEGYAIRALESGKIIINNAEISGGGKVTPGVTNPDTGITSPTTYLGAVTGAGSGVVEVQATKFHNNEVAAQVRLTSVQVGRFIVNRSNFENNTYDAVNDNSQIRPGFEYSWWGSPDGPDADKLVGGFSSDLYQTARTSAELRDPVVIVPGILGSWEVEDEWKIDPILHLYDNLVSSLKSQGYVEGQDLFVFPYDWYHSNIYTANDLREKISEIRIANNYWPKVDIVAHSMGGLVARQYIEHDQYLRDVDQLVTLGTPHNGSPGAYLTWEGGSFGEVDRKSIALKTLFKGVSTHAGYDSVFQYVRSLPVVSVQELLPIYSYIKDVGIGLREYPANYPFNDFLDNLSQPHKLSRLANVEFSNIVGNLSGEENTINIIRVEDTGGQNGVEWEHGRPENYFNLSTDRGLEKGDGDGTVPLNSAKSIPSDLELEINAEHSALPTAAASQVFQILTGETGLELADPIHIQNMLLIGVFSPVDIQIISPSGKKMGKNFETGGEYNDIPLAFYTGYNTENEFITIPNPEEGEYRILTQGVDGGGEYKIEAVHITEGESPSESASESKVEYSGTALVGEVTEEQVQVVDDQVLPVEDVPEDMIAPSITITQPESKEYLNSTILTPAYTVSDDISPEGSISKELLLDGVIFSGQKIELPLLPLGAHSFAVRATDEAGNVGLQTINFFSKVTFASLKSNVTFYGNKGLIKDFADRIYISGKIFTLESLMQYRQSLQSIPGAADWLIAGADQQIRSQKAELYSYMARKVSAGRIDAIVNERVREAIEVLTNNI